MPSRCFSVPDKSMSSPSMSGIAAMNSAARTCRAPGPARPECRAEARGCSRQRRRQRHPVSGGRQRNRPYGDGRFRPFAFSGIRSRRSHARHSRRHDGAGPDVTLVRKSRPRRTTMPWTDIVTLCAAFGIFGLALAYGQYQTRDVHRVRDESPTRKLARRRRAQTGGLKRRPSANSARCIVTASPASSTRRWRWRRRACRPRARRP